MHRHLSLRPLQQRERSHFCYSDARNRDDGLFFGGGAERNQEEAGEAEIGQRENGENAQREGFGAGFADEGNRKPRPNPEDA